MLGEQCLVCEILQRRAVIWLRKVHIFYDIEINSQIWLTFNFGNDTFKISDKVYIKSFAFSTLGK